MALGDDEGARTGAGLKEAQDPAEALERRIAGR
jgi:hypothetical protein